MSAIHGHMPTKQDPLLSRHNGRQSRMSRFSNLSFLPMSSIRRQSILRIGDIEGHQGNRCYNLLIDLIVFFVTAIEISVVIYLSLSHFNLSEGLMALSMLLPILLNFIGVNYFLSDKNERRELQTASSSRCATDFLQFPIVGPVFTALKILRVSCGCSTHRNYERLEASAIKMRQSCGFFSASPEALVQLTVLLTVEPKAEQNLDTYLEMFAVCLFTFTLAESNCYNPLSKYYKMFRDYETNDWKLHGVALWKKTILLIHAFASIGARIISSACLKSGLRYCFPMQSFPLVLAVCILSEISVRLVLFYISRFIKYFWLGKQIPSGCHESINYAWRATILDFGFQSTNIVRQAFFYFENIACFTFWIIAARNKADSWVIDTVFIPLIITYSVLMALSVVAVCVCHFFKLISIHGPCRRKVQQTLP